MRTIGTLLILGALTSGAMAHPSCLAAPQPPATALHKPSVPYAIQIIPRAEVHLRCGPNGTRDVTACTYPDEWPNVHGHWTILISDDLSRIEHACVVRYEKSHLPPNFWGDAAIEDAATAKWLAEQVR